MGFEPRPATAATPRGRGRFWCAVGLLAVAGCGGAPYEMAPVSGTLTIEGKPYPGGKVVLYPAATPGALEAGRPAFGKPDADGRFVMSTYRPGDGAIVGQHTVTVFAAPDHDTLRPDLAGIAFSRVTPVQGTVEVAAGENTIEVTISAAELRQRGNRL